MSPNQPITQRFIFRFWLPLAAMWLFMALEQPTLSAVIARLADPEPNLAAWGLTFSLALIVESPIIMFLAMGTALARSRQSYRLLMRFVHLMAWGLVALHLLIGLTPAYAFIVGRLIGAPAQVIEPSRIAFLFMASWPGAIAYRRFWQGVLIRHGRTRAVALTTAVRLASTATVALIGLRLGRFPGAYVAGVAVGAGVVMSAISAWFFVRGIVRDHLSDNKEDDFVLTWPALLHFYTPLAMTSFISLVSMPLISVGLSRAALPLQSLAIWPVLNGLMFLLRSLAMALQEVIVALLEDEESYAALRRFSYSLALGVSAILFLITLTPLSGLWFHRLAGLSQELTGMARLPAVLLTLVPGLTALTSWLRGVMIHHNHTAPITVATGINILVLAAALLGGARFLDLPGAIIAALALTASLTVDVAYLAWQARAEQRRQALAWAA